jgi:FAD:protein FMN transferase
MITRYRLLILLVCSVALASCAPSTDQNRIQFSGQAQGTYYMVTFYAEDTLVSQHEIDSLLRDFDMVASIYQEQSIISRLNRNETDEVTNAYFTEIFNLARRISEETDGAFDITVGPLVNAWGFGFKNRMDMNQQKVDSLLDLVGYKNIRLVNNTIIKDHPDIQIDFNAIAKGYAIDVIGGFLESRGIQDYLVDIGGEVLAKGTKPGNEKWIIGIEQPSEETTSERVLKATIKLEDLAVATSGNYRRFYEIDGIKYAHTIDPFTGYPVQHSLLSATVFADSTGKSDAYATAFMVMGLEKAKDFLDSASHIDAFLIFSDKEGEIKTYATEGVKKLLNER